MHWQGCSAAFPVFVPNGGGDTTTSTTTTNNNDNGSTGRQGQQGQSEGVALVAEVREVLAGKGAAQAYRALAERIFQVRRVGGKGREGGLWGEGEGEVGE